MFFFSCALRCLAELASSPISLLCSITCGITRGRRTEDLPPGGFLDGERGSETSDFIPKTYKKHHERSFNYWVYMNIMVGFPDSRTDWWWKSVQAMISGGFEGVTYEGQLVTEASCALATHEDSTWKFYKKHRCFDVSTKKSSSCPC